jgi:hypothetical protein
MPNKLSISIHNQVHVIIQNVYKCVKEETNCGNVADLKEVENII